MAHFACARLKMKGCKKCRPALPCRACEPKTKNLNAHHHHTHRRPSKLFKMTAVATTASAALFRALRSSTRHATTCLFSVGHPQASSAASTLLLQNNGRMQTMRHFSSQHPFVLSHPASVEKGAGENSRGRIVCITSGKGGVGKVRSIYM